jgi:hypothetical protein
VGAFNALVQGNRIVEEYEIRFMELVKYVSYMDNDQRQAECFVYGLNPKVRAMVRMWKPSSVAEAVENERYTEEHMSLNKDMRSTFPHHPGFVGKAPRTFSRGGSSRHLLMVIKSHQGQFLQVFRWHQVQHLTHHQQRRQVHDLLREQQVGAGVLGEGTHFRDHQRAVHRFHLVLHVGNVEDPITSMTAQSFKEDLCI